MINNWLKPSWEAGVSIKDISYKILIERGIDALILDVDGTLLPRSNQKVNSSVFNWIKETKKHLQLYLLSNNPSRNRIEGIARQLDLPFTYRASKPRKGAVLEAINEINLDKKKIGIVGDRILTDIFVGNRIGLYSILVKQIDSNGNTQVDSYMQFIEKKIAILIGAY